ncbi:uncharacterized abhydrolase domain-containing protein DDB_G0269086-like [Drosophila navojoa]|uniref:uncharacterized abhydrolase domain-containing protein DDB_G0269086-like n=1 Tax=Drosophila navojoa TaxID=7232 RepID=UPI0011BF3A1D|nr:uncharacterized abhydrolase domain-containing protein DDB_G0269086-like [Drosophila navojoa]
MSNMLYWRLSRPLYTYLSVRFVCYRPLAPMIRYFHEDKTEEFKQRLRQRMKKNAELKDDAAKVKQKASPTTIAESASLSKVNETKPPTSINVNESSPNLYGVECPIQLNADSDCSGVSSSVIPNPSQDKDIESSVETFEIRAKTFVESAKHKEKESERPQAEQASKNSQKKKPKLSPSTSTPIHLESVDSPKIDSPDPLKEKSKSFSLFRPEIQNETGLKISAKAKKTSGSQKDFKSYGLNESIKIEPFNSNQSVSHDSGNQKGKNFNLSRTQVNKETDIISTKTGKTVESLKDLRSEGGKDSFKTKSQIPWEGMFDHYTDPYISKTKLRKESDEKAESSKNRESKNMSMDGPKGQSKIEENRIEQLSQAEAEAEAKAEAEAEVEAELEEEMKIEPKAEAKAKAKEETRAKVEAKAISDAEARAKAEEKTKAEARAEAEAKAKAKAEAEAKAKVEAEAKAKAEAEARAKVEAEAKAKADAKAKLEAELVAAAKAEAEARAEEKAKAEAIEKLKAESAAAAKAVAEAKAAVKAKFKLEAKADRAQNEIKSQTKVKALNETKGIQGQSKSKSEEAKQGTENALSSNSKILNLKNSTIHKETKQTQQAQQTSTNTNLDTKGKTEPAQSQTISDAEGNKILVKGAVNELFRGEADSTNVQKRSTFKTSKWNVKHLFKESKSKKEIKSPKVEKNYKPIFKPSQNRLETKSIILIKTVLDNSQSSTKNRDGLSKSKVSQSATSNVSTTSENETKSTKAEKPFLKSKPSQGQSSISIKSVWNTKDFAKSSLKQTSSNDGGPIKSENETKTIKVEQNLRKELNQGPLTTDNPKNSIKSKEGYPQSVSSKKSGTTKSVTPQNKSGTSANIEKWLSRAKQLKDTQERPFWKKTSAVDLFREAFKPKDPSIHPSKETKTNSPNSSKNPTSSSSTVIKDSFEPIDPVRPSSTLDHKISDDTIKAKPIDLVASGSSVVNSGQTQSKRIFSPDSINVDFTKSGPSLNQAVSCDTKPETTYYGFKSPEDNKAFDKTENKKNNTVESLLLSNTKSSYKPKPKTFKPRPITIGDIIAKLRQRTKNEKFRKENIQNLTESSKAREDSAPGKGNLTKSSLTGTPIDKFSKKP